MSTTDAETIKDRRQANVMEKEVHRKKHRMASHQTIDEEARMAQRKSSMPQIQEAENEDKDYQTEVRPQSLKSNKRLPGISSKPTNLENYDINAAITNNKDSEPGNRQGDDEPDISSRFHPPPN